MKQISYILLAIIALLPSCTTETEPVEDDVCIYELSINATLNDYSDTPTTRAAMTWSIGDELYLYFRDGSKTTTGTAVYDGSKWTLETSASLTNNSSGDYNVFYFRDAKSTSSTSVSLDASSAIYEGSGTWKREASCLSIHMSLSPSQARMRFKGSSGTTFSLSGISYYTEFNKSTGNFTTSSSAISTSILQSGYSPYIYGRFTSSISPSLTILCNDITYSMSCPSTMLQPGKSGKLTLPTETAHNGWNMESSMSGVITGIELSSHRISIYENEQATLTYKVLGKDVEQICSVYSLDNKIASYDKPNALVIGVSAGMTEIVALAKDGIHTDTCVVVVNKEPTVDVTGAYFGDSSIKLEPYGERQYLKLHFTPENATPKSIDYSSSAKNVATAEKDERDSLYCVVTSKLAGTATITATIDGKITATCLVTVASSSIPVSSVIITASALTLEPNEYKQLSCFVLPDNASNKKVTWSSNDESVATVSSNGMVVAKAVGTAVITVASVDGVHSASCTVTVIGNGISVGGSGYGNDNNWNK